MSGYAPADVFTAAAPAVPDTPQPSAQEPAPQEQQNPAPALQAPAQAEPDKIVGEPVVKTEEQKPEVTKPAEPPVKVELPATKVNPLETLKIEDIVSYHKGKRDDFLKAYGLDEFTIDAIKYYESTGGLAEYASVKSVDYSKMSDEKVLRQQLREELANLELEDEDLELMYEQRIRSRYKLDEEAYSEREIKAAKLEMKLEADKARRGFIERQKKFAPPERKQDKIDTGPSPEEQLAEAYQAALSDNAVQQFVSGKKLVLGSGDQSFNYEIANPHDLLDIMFDAAKYHLAAARKDATGQPIKNNIGNYIPDYNRLLKATAVLLNDAEYDNRLINYGKSLGTKEVVDKMENPAKPGSPPASMEPANVWQAIKSQGVKWPDLPY